MADSKNLRYKILYFTRPDTDRKREKITSGKLPNSLWLVTIAFVLLITATVLAAPGTTTLGTRSSLSQMNPPITSNADAGWNHYTRDPEYPKSITLPLQFIGTREGGKLAVLVSLPAETDGTPVFGRFPVILTQTAYRIDLGKLIGTILPPQATLIIGEEDDFMIRRGYIMVAVDVRGTGMSSGVTALLGAEEQAAYADAVDWVTQQPWFDGNLGLAGTSYLGITSLLTAAQQHPAVKAVFAQMPMGDPYRGTVVPGGMIGITFLNLWLTMTQNGGVSNSLAINKYPQFAALIEAATQDHIQANDGWFMPTIYNLLNGEVGYATDDGDFWSIRSPVEKAKDIMVPTFIVGGANDIFQRSEPLLYEQLKNNVTTKLLVMPGAHIQAILNAMTSKDTNVSGGAPGLEILLLQWFDHYLKGLDTGAETLPNVTQYVEGYARFGGQRYASATDWPHPKALPQRFYLRGDMSLNKRAPLSNEASHEINEPEAPEVVINTNNNRVRLFGTISVKVNDGSDCSNSGVQWSAGLNGLTPRSCYTNDAIVEDEQKALIYETSPLSTNLYINGPMQADIWLSATHPQAAIAVRIDDVDRQGRAIPISTGIQSAVFRAVDPSRSRYVDGVMVQPWHPFTTASIQPLNPGEPVLVQVEIFPTAALIRTGHRLRIAISASNQVEGIWSLPQQAAVDGNITTIYNNSEHPSSLVVLTVPVTELKYE